jgi:hypothetical protein
MATAAQIQAALASAKAADLSYSDMAVLIRQAIMSAFLDGSGNVALPWQSTGSDGTNIVRMPIEAAQRLLDWVETQASSGVVCQRGEFRNP